MRWVAWIIAAAAVVAAVMIAPSSATTLPTKHQAKVRTFQVLLKITEQAPDATDATQASVTVDQCRRITDGWRCRGELAPVSQSGIPGLVCSYVVRVYWRSTRITAGAC